jgi:hypothetical protein
MLISFLKKIIHPFISIHLFLFLSFLSARLLPQMHGRWPSEAQRTAASESWRSAAVPARRGTLLSSPSHATMASLPLMRLMPPFSGVQPLLPTRHLW